MLIKINENNEIEEFATTGGLPNSIEIDDSLKPVDFNHLFKKGYYLYQDSEIIVNPNYEEPSIEIPTPEPSESDKQVAQLTYQQMMTTQDVTTLQTQNAQMAYQLMMMQKQGGEA